ncbi:C-terminal processing protease CtpA/Prc, contains a PDZ domain [Chitinophaga costaii]|uniref:C-terminal processing protease CtpA/Prc, contains a PDZ domain n=1 Tax=Chitinophaga costaii TaxID=1335309 RepID=A0A1C4G0J1_9BACT|nr:S41 family peptidase [Chitinophaga costaii]PUZ19958.1 hypothetical protein DCM91_19900 [Chitinophaga costaii]SCC61718.1 C-terminal processing protease CtpA/Prc, contains a PDZ domain [Chitinophaga costaii]
MNMFYRSAAAPLCLGVVLLAMAGISACSKKDHKSSGGTTSDTTATGTELSAADEDSLKYLMYRNMQVDINDIGDNQDLPAYYWYKSVPTLDPHSSIYPNADTLLNVMRQYAINATTGNPYDKYSFLDRDSSISTELEDGKVEATKAVEGDFGIQVVFAADNNNDVHTLVEYADKNSPAGKAGLTRGTELISVNGITDFSSVTNRESVWNAFYSGNATVSLITQQFGSSVQSSITLSAAAYNINPILFDTIYNTTQGNVGYFVFYTFTNTYNSAGSPTLTKQLLDAEIGKLKSANINNLIVDLRNNGGGAVATAEYLDSALAPSSAAGKTMYWTTYNDKLNAAIGVSGNGDETKFPSSTGGLSLDHIFFIVNDGTASAAELTMNNLKPYMDVKLVGDTTYGKPVGFIGASLRAHRNGKEIYLADLYAINFETKNSLLQGGYFTGIVPDQLAQDYVDVPFGNADYDENLLDIFNYINTGRFTTNGRQVTPLQQSGRVKQSSLNTHIKSLRFNGMINFRAKQLK